MKKVPVVYSTKTVVVKPKEGEGQDAQQPPPPPPPSPLRRTASARDTLAVDTNALLASPASQRRHASRRSASEGGSSNTPSAGSARHRSHQSQHRSVKKSTRLGERTVKRLHPSPALLQSDRITVAQCVKTMVEKKTEATLLVDRNGLLTGILTDHDIAVKVVALGKNPKLTRASDIMTPNPHCVASNASAIDALKTMVSGQFRHLPVADNEKVVGILDIAKCLYEAITKMERDYNMSSEKLSEAIKKLEKHLPGDSHDNLFEKLREKLFLPTLSTILLETSPVPVLQPACTALDAAQLMLAKSTSAVMVCNDANEMVGIVTSKDLMRRVVAMDIAPEKCILSSVMTINPFSAKLSTTILETLHSMHNGHFLHVPVFDETGALVGLVDVLQATCAIVQQVGMFPFNKNENVRPLWNQLRDSFTHDELNEMEDDVDRQTSENGIDIHRSENELSSLDRQDSWSELKEEDPTAVDPTTADTLAVEHPPDVFVFKLADWNGANHRFTSSAESLKELMCDVQNRLGDDTIQKVHYVDDDGDHVLLFTDDDLKDAVNRARTWGNKYIRLIVLHRVSRRSVHSVGHQQETALGIVCYAAAAAAIAGASFFLSRRR